MKKYFPVLFIFLCVTALKASPANDVLSFSLSTWSATLDPNRLCIVGINPVNGEEYLLGRGSEKEFSDPQIVDKTATSATLLYPSQYLTVKVTVIKNRLHLTFDSSVEQKLTWPILGEDPKTKAVIYPEGEGLYVPLRTSEIITWTILLTNKKTMIQSISA